MFVTAAGSRPDVYKRQHQALVFEFQVDFVEVRNGDAARPAPRGPKFDDVGPVAVEFFDRVALHPFAILKFGGRVTHFEGCLLYTSRCV